MLQSLHSTNPFSWAERLKVVCTAVDLEPCPRFPASDRFFRLEAAWLRVSALASDKTPPFSAGEDLIATLSRLSSSLSSSVESSAAKSSDVDRDIIRVVSLRLFFSLWGAGGDDGGVTVHSVRSESSSDEGNVLLVVGGMI